MVSPRLVAEQARHALGGGAGGEAARLQHDDLAVAPPGRCRNRAGPAERGWSCRRRAAQPARRARCAASVSGQARQGLVDRQGMPPHAQQIHADSCQQFSRRNRLECAAWRQTRPFSRGAERFIGLPTVAPHFEAAARIAFMSQDALNSPARRRHASGQESASHSQPRWPPNISSEGFWTMLLGSMGVVFGDIGTSPLYALQGRARPHENRRRGRIRGDRHRFAADLGAVHRW